LTARHAPAVSCPCPHPGRRPLAYILRIGHDHNALPPFTPPRSKLECCDDGAQFRAVARVDVDL
jgi:hypothetical protein